MWIEPARRLGASSQKIDERRRRGRAWRGKKNQHEKNWRELGLDGAKMGETGAGAWAAQVR